MKYITYNQNTGGRSGHKLNDIFSAYIFSFLIRDLEVCPHPSWQDQAFFDFDLNQTIKYSQTINIESEQKMNKGMQFNLVQKIKNQIKNAPDESLIILQGTTRILPMQLTSWFNDGLINENLFFTKFLPMIRNMYYKHNQRQIIDCLSIHVRRGDVADPQNKAYWRFWSVDYIDSKIKLFRSQYPNLEINVFSEKENSEDLSILTKHKNLNLHLGDINTLKNDINFMVNSKFFMLSNSNLPIWLSLISENTIIIPKDKKIKFFDNFQHPNPVIFL